MFKKNWLFFKKLFKLFFGKKGELLVITKFYSFSLLFLIVFNLPIFGSNPQPIFDFEANLSESGDLINGNKNVTMPIIFSGTGDNLK